MVEDTTIKTTFHSKWKGIETQKRTKVYSSDERSYCDDIIFNVILVRKGWVIFHLKL